VITHRIVTDGIEFKIQKLRRGRFLFWRESWEDIGQWLSPHTWTPTLYKTHDEALSVCEKLNRIEATRHPWAPIYETPR
jgi:hypothetical protein